MSDNQLEVYRAYRAGQEKYVYFLLAGAGAATAFAVTQTRDLPISWTQIPLAAAVLSWGISFYSGCMMVRYGLSNLFANFDLLRVQIGRHPKAGTDPAVIEAASEGILEAMQSNDTALGRWSLAQFRCLIAGAGLYLAWHILEMHQRTQP
jgi:hypothetical protein